MMLFSFTHNYNQMSPLFFYLIHIYKRNFTHKDLMHHLAHDINIYFSTQIRMFIFFGYGSILDKLCNNIIKCLPEKIGDEGSFNWQCVSGIISFLWKLTTSNIKKRKKWEMEILLLMKWKVVCKEIIELENFPIFLLVVPQRKLFY